jgi:hypothetical protein
MKSGARPTACVGLAYLRRVSAGMPTQSRGHGTRARFDRLTICGVYGRCKVKIATSGRTPKRNRQP